MGTEKETVREEQPELLEDLFESLETVVNKMEQDDVNLEEAFRLYQEGVVLLKKCNTAIDTVEKKVMALDEDGETYEF